MVRSQISLNCLQLFTTNFPRANIHELLTPDLLHQAIKGTFKDHLINWVQVYLEKQHGIPESKRILDEIDQRLAITSKTRSFSFQTDCTIGYHLCHPSQAFVGLNRGETFNSGQAMIPKL